MLDNDKLFKLQVKFANLNFIITVCVLGYYLLFSGFRQMHKFGNQYVVLMLVSCMTVDFVLAYLKYFNIDVVTKISKYVILMVTSFAMFDSRNILYTNIIFVILYVLYMIQGIIMFDITETYTKNGAVFYSTSPILVVLIISAVSEKNSNFTFFLIVMFILLLVLIVFNMTNILSKTIDVFYDRINALTGIATVNQEENSAMKLSQNKLVQVNEQLSIERFKLQQANELIIKNNKETELQYKIIKSISKTLDIDKQMNKINEVITRYMGIDLCSIMILSNDEIFDDMTFVHNSVYSKKSMIKKGNINLIETEEFVKEYINNGLVVDIKENANKKLDCVDDTKLESMIIYPVIISENIKGIYIIGDCKKNAFDNNRKFMDNLINQITLSLNNAMLYLKMEKMAVKDPLTGIYNRRYFNSISQKLLSKAQKKNEKVTVILFDIDKFKSINDTYGHVFGDEVISFCGHTALKYAKDNHGFPVRYGGEEFVILFPDKSFSKVLEIVEKMHEEIKQNVFNIDKEAININVSIGIASYPDNCSNPEMLLNSADNAMYISKKNGRGRITVYKE